jgi:uncharacterized membrane protein
MNQIFTTKGVHEVFIISLILKALNAVIEITGGILIFIVSQERIIKIALFLTQEEISKDPKDLIANYLITSAENFSLSAKHFIAFYLLSHGLVKLGVIIGLLKKKLWAYPAAFAVFSLFIVYQLYRYFHTHSLWLLVLAIFDLIVIWLIIIEYKNFSKQKLQ